METFNAYEISFTPIQPHAGTYRHFCQVLENMRIERRIFLFITWTRLCKKSGRKKKTTFFLSTFQFPGYLCSAKSEGWQVCGDPAIAPTGAADERASTLLCKLRCMILFEEIAPFFLLLRLLVTPGIMTCWSQPNITASTLICSLHAQEPPWAKT